MKSTACVLTLTLALLSSTSPWPSAAQTRVTSASGSYRFTSGDGLPKYVEFDAMADEKGSTTGQMSFSGQMLMSEQDAETAGDPRLSGMNTDFYMKAQFDCMTVSRNRAVMGGVVRDASPKGYAGRRVMLVVEDSGDDLKAGDRVTWILYNPSGGVWVPKDAERADDNGASLTWIAKDAERADDVGVRQPKNSSVVGCQEFPLSSHSFVTINYQGGDIKVQP